MGWVFYFNLSTFIFLRTKNMRQIRDNTKNTKAKELGVIIACFKLVVFIPFWCINVEYVFALPWLIIWHYLSANEWELLLIKRLHWHERREHTGQLLKSLVDNLWSNLGFHGPNNTTTKQPPKNLLSAPYTRVPLHQNGISSQCTYVYLHWRFLWRKRTQRILLPNKWKPYGEPEGLTISTSLASVFYVDNDINN